MRHAGHRGGQYRADTLPPDILPVILAAIECPTHFIVDAALRTLPSVLPVLDFSTIKNELFPVVATVFSRTNSLAIKVRGLQAFVILCGGSTDAAADDGLNGLMTDKKKSSPSALDKYTMQEKIVPLIKGIKTKEPVVMIAALNVLRIVGETADGDFVAMDILPVLWSMSLGPLLDLKQFQTFMELIKLLSRRVEDEQTRKLQETSALSNGSTAGPNEDFVAFGGVTGTTFDAGTGGNDDDFEALVKGRATGGGGGGGGGSSNNGFASWEEMPSGAPVATTANRSRSSTPQTPSFSWSTPGPASPTSGAGPSQAPGFRTVTPDLARFGTLTPASTQFSQPLQPLQPAQSNFQAPKAQPSAPAPSLNWSSAPSSAAMANPWASTPNYAMSATATPTATTAPSMASAMSAMSLGQGQRPGLGEQRNSSFSLPPPPGGGGGGGSGSLGGMGSFGIRPPPPPTAQQPQPQQINWAAAGMSSTAFRPAEAMGAMGGGGASGTSAGQAKSGLDKYESLI